MIHGERTRLRLHHLALRTADLERSRRFYGELIGLPEVRRNHDPEGELRSIWLEAGDALLMLELRLAGEGPTDGSAHLLAFAVDDLGSWRARLAEAAIRLDGETEHTLYFRDPDQHRVAVSTHPGGRRLQSPGPRADAD